MKKLQERKSKLSEEDSKQHVAKSNTEEVSEENDNSKTLVPFSSEDPVEVRRRRAIEAAERRRNQTPPRLSVDEM